jgi:hypothetical protein
MSTQSWWTRLLWYVPFLHAVALLNTLAQTECVREYEHMRYIPIVLLAPSLPRLNC